MQLDYQLHRLGWKAFQQLCATILRESMGQTLQTFADVKDAGRDGAFHGQWRPAKGEVFRGQSTIQCKHSARVDEKLQLGKLKTEIDKARILAAKGLAENYLLLTNMSVTGATTQLVEDAFTAVRGIQRAKVYGREWIEAQIHENKQVRMNVPRIYGLGDLSQILDERAHAQARAVLSTLGDDFSRFVVTEAHRKSVSALVSKGFVFLLGEPCCGKSTIAAALALAAADKWQCELVRVTEPRDLRHWNPHASNQLFWVDDAFGSTQYERELALAWNRVFPTLAAALKKGAKAVFTSRDYVYTAALEDLKDLSLPELRDSRVVIHVEELTCPEREQILYNHIKLGRQPAEAKSELKKHLPDIASHPRFLPETARRLSEPLFTKELEFTKPALLDFVTNVKEFLVDTLRTMGRANSAAVALVFMRRGNLPCDLNLTASEKSALDRLGAGISDVRVALKGLQSSLFTRSSDARGSVWRFKHPSVRDAFGTLIADDPTLSDIYLEHAPIRSLLREITCGGSPIEGVKVDIPQPKFGILLRRLQELRVNDAPDLRVLVGFLRNRCGKLFLRQFLEGSPSFISRLRYNSWMIYSDSVQLAAKLHEHRLLPGRQRHRLARHITDLTLRWGDAAVYRVPEIHGVLTDTEHRLLRRSIRNRIFASLRADITSTKRDCLREKRDGWSAFAQVKANLDAFEKEFSSRTFQRRIAKVRARVQDIQWTLYSKRKATKGLKSETVEAQLSARSIFDDVDR